MLARLLGLKDVESVNYFSWHLRQPWPRALIVVLLLVVVAYVVWLYRREAGLPRVRRIALGALRAVILAVLVLMLFEPAYAIDYTKRAERYVLVLVDRSESMKRVEARERPEDLRDAAVALGKVKFENLQNALLDPHKREINSASRLDLAKGLLTSPSVRIFDDLSKANTVKYFTFNRAVQAMPDRNGLATSLAKADAQDKWTSVGTAVQTAVQGYAGQTIAAVVVISDGAANEGLALDDVAKRMKDRGVPVYTVGMGIPDPSDVRVDDIDVQQTVFANDRVQARVRVDSSGYNRQSAPLVLTLDGLEVGRKNITLTGGTQYEDFSFIPERKSEAGKLAASIAPPPGDSAPENNSIERPIKVIDEKIKVLYVEGKPRWEYRYLRAVLQRDRRLDVRFLMTQGDPDLARYSPQYIDRFPDDVAAFAFDMVILGDVPFSYFTPQQVERMHKLVGDQGGSLLMLAGRRYAPMTYAGSDIGKMLPVEVGRDVPLAVDNNAHPVVTQKGLASAAVMLDENASTNGKLWEFVRPMHQLPMIRAIKPGATVLAELSEPVGGLREKYPLVAWHRFGQGKVMFVATDQLWRLRYKQGDRHHARFWGQTIQFMSLSRLLGGNKRMTLRIDRKEYQPPSQVAITANVLNESYEPTLAAEYNVLLQRKGDAETIIVKLDPVRESPGLFQGFFNAERDGDYVLKAPAEDQQAANAPEFTVKTVDPENRNPRMQEQSLRQLAELSGGKYVPVRQLNELPEMLGQTRQFTTVRVERELWDLPAVFVLICLFAGVEWFVRRRSNLV